MDNLLKYVLGLAGFYILYLVLQLTHQPVWLFGVILMLVLIYPYLMLLRNRSPFSNNISYEELAKQFNLAYSKDGSGLPDLSKDQEFARKYFSLGPARVSYKQEFTDLITGDINGNKIELINIFIRDTFPPLYPIQKALSARCTTRLKINGQEKYISLNRMESVTAYGTQFAPTSVIENIFNELLNNGTSQTFNQSLGLTPFQGRSIVVTYLSFYEGAPDSPTPKLQAHKQALNYSIAKRIRRRAIIYVSLFLIFAILIYLSSDYAPTGYELENIFGM